VLGAIYELADSRDLPLEAQSEDGGLFYRMRAKHHVQEPNTAVDRASDEEIVALFAACLSARDRLIVLLLSRAGLRRSETAGLRRSDLHLLPDNRSVDCDVEGAHVHVIRRENINGAWAKSRHTRAVPLDFLLVRAIDQYHGERGPQRGFLGGCRVRREPIPLQHCRGHSNLRQRSAVHFRRHRPWHFQWCRTDLHATRSTRLPKQT
jgi:integrase